MSALRDYYGVGDTPDDYHAWNVWWDFVLDRYYFRNNGFLPPRPHQSVLLGKF